MIGSTANLNNAFDPMLALRAVRKRWVLALLVLIAGGAVGILAALQIKPKFESDASLLVQLGRESAGLDPTATTGEMTPIYETREQELNSALEVMQSRKLLEAVLAVIGEDIILKPERFDFNTWQQSLQDATWSELDPELRHHSDKTKELAIAVLHRTVNLGVSRSSNVMSLSSTAVTPELAQAITTTMLEAFRKEHVRLYKSRGFDFFTEQVRMLDFQLNEAREAVIVRKNELGVMSIDGERVRLEDELTALEKSMQASGPDLAGALAAIQVYEQTIKSLPDRTQPHDATDTLRKTLNELEQQRSMLLTKYMPRHHRVEAVEHQIATLNEQLADPKNKNAANPTLRELEIALANERAKVSALEASIIEQRKTQALLRVQLTRLNDAEVGMAMLADQVNELTAAKSKATLKLDQARVLDRLSAEQISNIRIVQPPTFNPTSMSPSRSMVALGGLFVGLVAALIIPALIEFALWYLQIVKTSVVDDSEGMLSCGG